LKIDKADWNDYLKVENQFFDKVKNTTDKPQT